MKHFYYLLFFFLPYALFSQENDKPIGFTIIEDVPVFPGCTGNTEELKRCMSHQINKIIKENFNTDVVNGTNLQGKVRIMIQFVIDKNGDVVDLKIEAPHPFLDAEAERLMRMIPQMRPGKFRGNPVPVSYALPIIFKVQPED